MSATLETTNYGLPLYQGTDYANFFDMNTTNNKLDEVLKSIQTTAENADTKANANTSAIEQANDSIIDNMETIDHIQTDLTTVQQNVNSQSTRIDNVETSVTGVQQTLGVVSGEVATNTEDIAGLKAVNTIKYVNISIGNCPVSTTYTIVQDASTIRSYKITVVMSPQSVNIPSNSAVIGLTNIIIQGPGGVYSVPHANSNGQFSGTWTFIIGVETLNLDIQSSVTIKGRLMYV